MIGSFLEWGLSKCYVLPVTHGRRSIYSNQINRIKKIGRRLTENENKQAISLIAGERKYRDFTPKEKRIVNRLQDQMMEEDWIILPNTKAAIEDEEVQKRLEDYYKNKYPKSEN